MLRAMTFVVSLMLAGAQATQTPVPKGLESLQGTWSVMSVNGEAAPAGMDFTLTVTGDKYVSIQNGAVDERGTLKVDPTKKPMTIDFIITEGQDQGKTQLGLVEVTGDTVRFHLGGPGEGTRPADFTPGPGTGLIVATKKK